jgi:hypothetical protein
MKCGKGQEEGRISKSKCKEQNDNLKIKKIPRGQSPPYEKFAQPTLLSDTNFI